MATSRLSGSARHILKASVQELCCSEDERTQEFHATQVAVAYSTESADMWSELWERLVETMRRTLGLFAYTHVRSGSVEPLIDVDDDKETPSVRANAHIRCFRGCCALALQLLRTGCSSAPVAPPTAQLFALVNDTAALRIQAQVQANPNNVAFTVGARDGELPKLSLARIEPIIQTGVLRIAIQLLTIQDLVMGYSQQLSRLLNLCSAFITTPVFPSESTQELGSTTLELISVAAASFPHVFVSVGASAAAETLVARLLEVTEHCCKKPSSIIEEAQATADISVEWCVQVFAAVRRVLLFCSPILAEKPRRTIEGSVCMLLSGMSQGLVQPLVKDKHLKREQKSLVRSDTRVQCAVLQLAHIEVQTLQHTGGIGANLALLRPVASLCLLSTSTQVRDEAMTCFLITDSIVRPIAAPLDLQPAIRRMEDHLTQAPLSNDGLSLIHAIQQPTDKKRPAEHEETAQPFNKRLNFGNLLKPKAAATNTAQGVPAPAAPFKFDISQRSESGATTAPPSFGGDDDDLPDIIQADPDQL